jgi:hypothetical protein
VHKTAPHVATALRTDANLIDTGHETCVSLKAWRAQNDAEIVTATVLGWSPLISYAEAVAFVSAVDTAYCAR